MQLYSLEVLDRFGRGDFAGAIISEPIVWDNQDEVCTTCLQPIHRRRAGPLTITWVPGSDVV